MNCPEKVFNCDETPLPASAKPTKAVAAKGTRHVYKLASPNNKQTFTMLATINAAGWLLNPFMVLQGERVTEQLATNVPEKVDFVLSEAGYQTNVTFRGK